MFINKKIKVVISKRMCQKVQIISNDFYNKLLFPAKLLISVGKKPLKLFETCFLPKPKVRLWL